MRRKVRSIKDVEKGSSRRRGPFVILQHPSTARGTKRIVKFDLVCDKGREVRTRISARSAAHVAIKVGPRGFS